MSRWVPYHAESVQYAKELVKGCKSDSEKYRKITSFVSRTFVYDYIRALHIPKKNQYPDVDRCWKLKMGICMDISSMTVGMLRAVGLEAYLCYGYTEKTYHAWVETKINGVLYRYDHSGRANMYKVKYRYT